MNTEHLEGQLDIEDAIRDEQIKAEEELETNPQRLVMSARKFEAFIEFCWHNPRARRQMWPHLTPARRILNRADRRKFAAEARADYKRLGHARLVAEMAKRGVA